MKKVLVMMPAFNEEESIGGFLKQLVEVCPKGYDILIINDGSSDKTEQIVRAQGIKIINQVFNLGYGSALQVGYKYAVMHHYDFVMQLDADGQHDVMNIMKMKEIIESDDEADIIIGSRFLAGSKSFSIPLIKKIVIKFFQFTIEKMSGQHITDPTSGLQCLNRKAFEYYAVYTNFDHQYPDINMIIQMSIKGYKIKEFAAIMHPRTAGVSMHGGIWKPFVYIILMTISTINVFCRESFELRKRRKTLK